MVTDVEAPKKHDVFESPDLLTRLLIHQADLGYRLVTFYTACTTVYVGLVGVAAQYYFQLVPRDHAGALRVAVFGFVVSLFALFAPFGLEASRRQIAREATLYAAALSISPEEFTVVRFGGWLSLVAFVAISFAWLLLIFRAL